jgi:hypothetical protein
VNDYCLRLFLLTISLLIQLGLWVEIAVAQVKPVDRSSERITQQIPPPAIEFTPRPLPVGLIVNGQTKLESFTILGQEDGSRAIRFEDWLLPFDELSQTLGFKVKEVDGQLEISNASQKFRLPANVLIVNKTLGMAIAVRDLAKIPGFTIEFDLYKYAIDLKVPTGGTERIGLLETPIVFDGLSVTQPGGFGINIIEQRVINSGVPGGISNTQGELQAAGNIFDAGWYLRVNQPTFGNLRSWNISDGTILRQRNSDDLILGSQTPFWRNTSSSGGNYWGATAIFRNGFTPPTRLSGGNFSLAERLQAKRVGRTISGLAEPGTLVQLVTNDRNQLVREILVDTSGVYRFDNIVVGAVEESAIGRDYKILLYPRGQLTANPIVQDISFTTIPGQIPVGADVFVVSAGANRQTEGRFGSFNGKQGGVLYRRGVLETLTLGAGIAYDREIRGIGDLIWQPSDPLEVAMSAITDSQAWDFLGRLNYRPSQTFGFSASTDRFSTTTNANWRFTPNWNAVSTYESRRGATVGLEYFDSGTNSSTLIRSDISDRGQIRTAATQRWENFQASLQRNESSNTAELSYRIPPEGSFVDSGHEFILGYQSSRQIANSSLASGLWRYRSPERVGDGRSLFQTELGYGFNGRGENGYIANADLNFIPGFQLRGSYRGISDNSSLANYALELTTTLLTSGGIRGTFDRVENFRTLGKIVFQPFLDKNQNGRQDRGEDSYWDPLLIRINERPIDRYRPQINNNLADFNLPNGSYRIDIDPAGYPINYRSRIDALRVEVVPSGVTTVSVPLVPAYTTTGVVKDTKGDAVPGARVEATNLKTKTKVFSITNDTGFYALESLEQGEYQISVSGLPAKPDKLVITSTSQPNQELNLTVDIPTETPTPTPAPTPAPTPNNRSFSPLKLENINHSLNF